MPNYCENQLSIEGKWEKVEDFMSLLKDENNEVCFKNILPMPSDIEDWYHWSIDNYGTKWDGGFESNFNGDEVSFYTAWSPPLAFFDTASKQFSGLTFTLIYFESGCDFCGVTVFENGKRIRDEYDICDSQLARELFGEEYIDEYFAE